MKRTKIIDTLITLAIWFIITLPIHEFWHYEVGSWLGGERLSVTYPNFFSGLCSWPTPFPNMWLAYLAGGVGTAIILFLLGWRALQSPTKWDEDDVFSLFFLGGVQLGYGIGELSLLYYPSLFPYLSAVGIVVVTVPILIWRLPKLLNWILDNTSK